MLTDLTGLMRIGIGKRVAVWSTPIFGWATQTDGFIEVSSTNSLCQFTGPSMFPTRRHRPTAAGPESACQRSLNGIGPLMERGKEGRTIFPGVTLRLKLSTEISIS